MIGDIVVGIIGLFVGGFLQPCWSFGVRHSRFHCNGGNRCCCLPGDREDDQEEVVLCFVYPQKGMLNGLFAEYFTFPSALLPYTIARILGVLLRSAESGGQAPPTQSGMIIGRGFLRHHWESPSWGRALKPPFHGSNPCSPSQHGHATVLPIRYKIFIVSVFESSWI